MSFGLTAREQKKIVNVLQKFSEIDAVYIIGSRAKETYKKTSDIDLLVFAPTLSFDRLLTLKVMLNKLSIIYTIDVIHYERISD